MDALGHRSFLVIFAFIIAVLITDTSIRQLSVFTGGLGTGSKDLALFVAMILVYAVGQYLILLFLRQSQLHFQLSYRLIFFSQYLLIAILASITLQVIFTGGYSSLLMRSVIWINYVIFIVMMGLLSQRFLSWSRSNRNKVVIAYGISMALLSVSGIFTILYVNNALSGQRGIDYIEPLRSPLAIVASVENVFSSSYFMSNRSRIHFHMVRYHIIIASLFQKIGINQILDYCSYSFSLFSQPISRSRSGRICSTQSHRSNFIWCYLYAHLQCYKECRRYPVRYRILEGYILVLQAIG